EQWPVKSFMDSDPSRGEIGEIPTSIRYDQRRTARMAEPPTSPRPVWYFPVSYVHARHSVHTSILRACCFIRDVFPPCIAPWRASPCVSGHFYRNDTLPQNHSCIFGVALRPPGGPASTSRRMMLHSIRSTPSRLTTLVRCIRIGGLQ